MNKNASVVKQIEPWLLMCFFGRYYFAKPGFGAIIYSSKIIPIPEITRVKTVIFSLHSLPASLQLRR